MICSSCLPDWALDLSQHFPFLFAFTTRYAFLQSTSFGTARVIQPSGICPMKVLGRDL